MVTVYSSFVVIIFTIDNPIMPLRLSDNVL